jgi:hypothetical protein
MKTLANGRPGRPMGTLGRVLAGAALLIVSAIVALPFIAFTAACVWAIAWLVTNMPGLVL